MPRRFENHSDRALTESTAATIVGVMPERFGFPRNDDIWLPLDLDPLALTRPIRSYSNGQQKKVAICSALVADAQHPPPVVAAHLPSPPSSAWCGWRRGRRGW